MSNKNSSKNKNNQVINQEDGPIMATAAEDQAQDGLNEVVLNTIIDQDSPKAEAPKVEEPKVEEPKVEEPKVEEPKVEAPKAEALKVEEPKVEDQSDNIYKILGYIIVKAATPKIMVRFTDHEGRSRQISGDQTFKFPADKIPERVNSLIERKHLVIV